jgi:PAS domain S-box-containing protein
MRRLAIPPSGREVTFREDEIIVSKTDRAGVITYANDVFQRVSGFSADELLGQPHNLIRHPDMPRCVFKLLWDTIEQGQEIFAYVINQAKNGDHYWVFAHVTPSYDQKGAIVGYHSNRRVPYPDALPKVRDLYKTLRGIESSHTDPRAGIAASTQAVLDLLHQNNLSYGQFVFSLSRHTTLDAAA